MKVGIQGRNRNIWNIFWGAPWSRAAAGPEIKHCMQMESISVIEEPIGGLFGVVDK